MQARSWSGFTAFSQHLLQHVFAERQIGDQLRELAVLLLDLATVSQPTQFGHGHPSRLCASSDKTFVR